MTPDEIQAMAQGIAEASGGSVQWIGYLIAAIAGGGFAFLGGYLAEKGKGRATKEDVATVTDLVEEVRSEYLKELEDLKAHHQLRMVAAEKRLLAHQQAHLWWVKLNYEFENGSLQILEDQASLCKEWYDENCVFLAPTSREAFVDMYCSVLDARKEMAKGDEADQALIDENETRFERARVTFLHDVELPHMSTRKNSVSA